MSCLAPVSPPLGSHEAALWDDAIDRWLFLPRRASAAAWSAELDEERGANLMLWSEGGADPIGVFHGAPAHLHVRMGHVAGPLLPQRGFSSAKLLPGTGTAGVAGSELMVALRTEELRGRMATYLTVLSTNGSVLMEDTLIDEVKYEGIEVAV